MYIYIKKRQLSELKLREKKIITIYDKNSIKRCVEKKN